MKTALSEAALAAAEGEVPVGAVIVKDGEILARAHNLTEKLNDPTAHAEVLAIREAASKLGWARLTGCTMYVTVEPCAMCAGAIVWARIEELVIGTMDPKAGACGSLMDIPEDERLNHRVNIRRGMLADECAGIMKDFFAQRRRERRNR
ncbi:MAG: tRNA adenosine(34) deaminase TadA [Firmicutes bacterium]|nr:tRNA adenosine(34) deaminase TadA [Bacillota bacterium]